MAWRVPDPYGWANVPNDPRVVRQLGVKAKSSKHVTTVAEESPQMLIL